MKRVIPLVDISHLFDVKHRAGEPHVFGPFEVETLQKKNWEPEPQKYMRLLYRLLEDKKPIRKLYICFVCTLL